MEQSYKEKYEDIIARLERAKNDNDVCDERFCCVINEIIPELAESEDERVRKEIINYFQCQSEEEPTRKEIHNKWIAWLENIPVTIDHEKRDGFHLGYKACLERQGEQKPEENKGNIGGISSISEWSEEDEAALKQIDASLRVAESYYFSDGFREEVKSLRNWLKSLKGRVQPQNTWKPNDEQIAQLQIVIDTYGNEGICDPILTELLFQLKKLKGEV